MTNWNLVLAEPVWVKDEKVLRDQFVTLSVSKIDMNGETYVRFEKGGQFLFSIPERCFADLAEWVGP